MVLTEFGIVMDDKNEHPHKYPHPMDITEFGIAMNDKDEHP
jgi:hypothetical protein